MYVIFLLHYCWLLTISVKTSMSWHVCFDHRGFPPWTKCSRPRENKKLYKSPSCSCYLAFINQWLTHTHTRICKCRQIHLQTWKCWHDILLSKDFSAYCWTQTTSLQVQLFKHVGLYYMNKIMGWKKHLQIWFTIGVYWSLDFILIQFEVETEQKPIYILILSSFVFNISMIYRSKPWL